MKDIKDKEEADALAAKQAKEEKEKADALAAEQAKKEALDKKEQEAKEALEKKEEEAKKKEEARIEAEEKLKKEKIDEEEAKIGIIYFCIILSDVTDLENPSELIALTSSVTLFS